MSVITNNDAAITFGKDAAKNWATAQSKGDAGDALATCALYLAHYTMTFTATVSRKGSDIDETIDFTVADLASPLFNADGSKDIKAMAARTATLAKRVFEIDTLNNAIKTRLSRCIERAIYLANAIGDVDDFADKVTIKANKLVVPYGLVHEAPVEGVDSDNDIAVHDAMKDKLVSLDGKNGNSLAELSKRARPKATPRAATAPANKGDSLVESVKFVHAIMLQQIDPAADETDVALSSDLRRMLFDLQVTLGAYFVADPIEGEEKKAA